MTRRPHPTHLLWCSRCCVKTPHASRPELQVPRDAVGLLWECMRCQTKAPRAPSTIYTSERLFP